MSLEPAAPTERNVATRQAPENAERFVSHITQDGSTVHLQLDSDCQLQTYNRVETTKHSTTVNKSAWVDWTFGISGVALLGLGTYALVDSSKTYPNDTSSRTYNSAGPSGDVGLAVGAFAAGGALIAIAVVDVVRAQHTEQTSSYGERKGDVAGKCPSTPVAGANITGAFAKGSITPMSLGSTTSTGSLDVDLAALSPSMPGDTSGEPYGSILTLSANGTSVGTATVSSAYAAWQASWGKQDAARRRAIQKNVQDEAKDAAEAKVASDSSTIEQLEKDASELEDILSKIERTKDPWGVGVISRFVDVAKLLGECRRRLDAPLDSRFTARLTVLGPRLDRITAHAKLLAPRVVRNTERLTRERAAEEAAAARQWEAERPQREAQERRQQEASETERRQHQMMDQQKELAHKSCNASCQGIGDRGRRFDCERACP